MPSTSPSRGARRWRRTAQCSRRDCRSPLCCSCCFRGLRPAVGPARRSRRARPDCPTRWRRASISELSLSDAVAFRVDFDSRRPRRAQRYWRGPVLSRFDGREWTVADRRRRGGRFAAADRRGGPLHGDARAERSRGCSRSICPSACRRSIGRGHAGERGGASLGYSRDQQLIDARARHPAVRYSAAVDAAATAIPVPASLDAIARTSIAREPRRQSAHARVRARAACARNPDDRRLHRAVLQWFHDEAFFYTLAPPLLDERSGRRVPVRRAARLLRALRERVRRACCAPPAFRRAW